MLILATGYSSRIPAFRNPVKECIHWLNGKSFDVNRDYSVNHGRTIFVQNADLFTHGFNSADLGMGAYRNAIIINSILKGEVYKTESNISFQTFGLP